MQDQQRTNIVDIWSSTQVYTLAVVCLLIGIAGGWFIRGSQGPGAAAQAASAGSVGAPSSDPTSTPTMPSPEQLKQMADTQAKPVLDRLQSDPNNVELLTNAGNTYYDAQQYPTAATFYERALKLHPKDTGVRTDLATAYWYMGNADKAIDEFNRSLSYEPTKANTLFNLGIVKWQGKMDVPGAVAAWQKLLDTNPNYEAKDKVVQLMAEAQKHAGLKTTADNKQPAQ
jgi:cytochrome c-type biogenesis protein CcmH/NrfG